MTEECIASRRQPGAPVGSDRNRIEALVVGICTAVQDSVAGESARGDPLERKGAGEFLGGGEGEGHGAGGWMASTAVVNA